MQVAFYLAGVITQVLDAIPWVRCASGNVYLMPHTCDYLAKCCSWTRGMAAAVWCNCCICSSDWKVNLKKHKSVKFPRMWEIKLEKKISRNHKSYPNVPWNHSQFKFTRNLIHFCSHKNDVWWQCTLLQRVSNALLKGDFCVFCAATKRMIAWKASKIIL